MKRRRFVLGLGGTLAAAGCAAPGGGGTGRPGDPIVLTLLSHYGSEPLKSALNTVVAQWNATHDRVKVHTRAVRFQDLLTTFMVRQAAGQGADILHPYALWAGQLVAAGVLRPAPPDAAAEIRNTFSAAAARAATVDGRVYGYPTEVQPYALYCNQRLLRAAGIGEVPRTWRELEESAGRAARRDRHGNTLVQGLGLSVADDSTVVGTTLALMASGGSSFLAADGRSTAMDSATGRDVLALEQRLIRRGASDPGINLYQAFPSGQVAMAVQGAWWTGSLKASMGAQYRDILVAPVPGRTPRDRGTIATGFFLGVNAASRHPREAWEFLRWLNADSAAVTAPGEPGRRVIATRMSAVQVAVGSLTGRAGDMRALHGTRAQAGTNLGTFLDALEYARPEPNAPRSQKAKTLLRKNIEAMWTGQQSAGATLRTITRQVDQELSRPL